MGTLALILIVLWGLSLVTSYTMGGYVHVLLVVALLVGGYRLMVQRRPPQARS